MTRRRRLFGSLWQRQFNSSSGISASLVLNYSGKVGGQFYDGTLNTLSFDDIHTPTGASLATQRDPSGNVVFKPHNLRTRSNAFATVWSVFNADAPTQVENGPDGVANSAWLFVDDNGGGSGSVRLSIGLADLQLATTYRLSIFAKKNGHNGIAFKFAGFTDGPSAASLVAFDLNSGAVHETGADWSNVTVENVSNGFVLCTAEFTTVTDVTGTLRLHVYDVEGSTITVEHDGGSSIFVYGAAMTQTPMAAANDTLHGAYVPTAATIVYQHRLDHDKDGNRIGLLLEKAKTNVALESEDFDTTWSESGTVTTSQDQTAPSGVANNAWTLTDGGAGSMRFKYQDITITNDATDWTLSCFLKKTTSTAVFPGIGIRMSVGTGVLAFATLNTDNGTITGRDSLLPDSSLVEEFTDYWRFSITIANNNTGNTNFRVEIYPAINTDGSATWANAATGSNVFWGVGVENAAFPSSYIRTRTVAVTRALETAPVLVSKYAYSATLGSVAANVTPNHTPTAEMILVSFNDTTANEVIQIVADSSANVVFDVTDGGAGQTDPLDSLVNAVGGTELKVAASWAANDFAVSVNGATIKVDTGGTLPTLTTIDPCDNGHTASIRAWNVTLSDADLVAEGA